MKALKFILWIVFFSLIASVALFYFSASESAHFAAGATVVSLSNLLSFDIKFKSYN